MLCGRDSTGTDQQILPRGETTLHVLRDVDLRVERGELVSLMGSSGSGKSTLLNILGILDFVSFRSYGRRLFRGGNEWESAVYLQWKDCSL